MIGDLNLECYDLSWSYEGDGGIRVDAVVPDGRGGKRVERIPAPFEPYFWIDEQSYYADPFRASGCRVSSDPGPDGYIKVVTSDPMNVKKFKDRFTGECYESDVRYAQRVAIDCEIEFLRPPEDGVLYFDIEVDDRGEFAEPDGARNRVISIAAIGSDGSRYYYDDEDEWSLISSFIEDADDYVVLAGWNSLSYDFPYLENRVAKLGKSVDWRRWVKHDMMPLYDTLAVPTKTVSLKLDDVGYDEFGEGKTGVEAGGGRLYDLWRSGDPALESYNMRDVEIVARLDDRYGLIDLLHVVCDICGHPPEDACYVNKFDQVKFAIGNVVDSKLLSIARVRDEPQPDKRSFSKPNEFPGGYVLQPKPGDYNDVVVPDYSGMYPNIVRAWNFGRETFVPDELIAEVDGGWVAIDGRWAGCDVIKGETGGFVHPDEGRRSVPAEAADELISIRENAGDIVDKGVKAINNTLYGVFTSDYHRYFGPYSENITLLGQRLTGIVEELAGGGHPFIEEVIYGDTDSVMIEMADPDDPIEAARVIAADIEDGMKKWASERGAFAEYLELDVDDVYSRFFIGDKKKRYFGRRIWSGGPCDDVKIRGYETRQQAWPEPVREFQRTLMDALLEDGPIRDIIEEYRTKLFDGRFDHDLATRTTLGKPVSEYVSDPPQARAAEQIREHFGSGTIDVGDKVGYIKYGREKEEFTWSHAGVIGDDFRSGEGYCVECGTVVPRGDHPHELEDFPHFRDSHYSYIWGKKFMAVMDSIGVSEYKQTTLAETL